MILIAGAGLAGLSAAYHLGRGDYRIIERESRPGGLCKSESFGPYRFDYGGHLLHLRRPPIRKLVEDLLGGRLKLFERRSAVFSHGLLTPYPFQANTYGLPAEVVRDCLLGFVEALLAAKDRDREPENFHDWVLAVFGRGFASHFFSPFNRKFFKLDLHELTTEWAAWSIPRPSLAEVVDGSLGLQQTRFGYNVEFFYPEGGGIEELPRAVAAGLAQEVETGVELMEVDPVEKRAVLSTGEEVRYGRLVSTLPLPRLLGMLRKAPEEIREAAKRLRSLSVLCVNLGVSGPPLGDQHWIYFPDPCYTFHRIGFYSLLSGSAGGKNSLYLEITVPTEAGSALSALGALSEQAVREFEGLPLFRGSEHRLEFMQSLLLEPGYVIYDRFREEKLGRVFEYLRGNGILVAGRYGRWEYSTMEDALWQGREVAEEIKKS